MFKSISSLGWWSAPLVIVLTGLAGVGVQAQGAAPLFLTATRQAARTANNDATVVRAREVDVQVPVLAAARAAGSRLDLTLFPDAAYTATLDRVETGANGYVWVGHLEDVPLSTVSLAVEGTTVDGAIFLPGATYLVKPAGNGVSRIVEIDQSRFPRETEPIEPSAAPPVKPATPRVAAVAADTTVDAQGDSGSLINVLILYTPAAAAAAGGTTAMNTLIANAVAIANTAYGNSAVTQRLRLAGSSQVSYTESGNNQTDLTNLTNGAGAFSGVAALRDSTRADLVSLMTNTPGSAFCGVAWLMSSISTSFAPNGFSVVEQSCAVGNLTFPHELGHNMGLRHDWYMDAGVTPASYAHGYVNSAARWRTIMAYNDRCAAQGFNCTRLPLWSNPWVTNSGAPTGVVGGTSTACLAGSLSGNCDADDHRLLNESGFYVANFRQNVVGASLAVDFGAAYGLWQYTETSGSGSWLQLHPQSPTLTLRADVDGNGVMDTIAVFTGYGAWAYMNNATWTQLHPYDATIIKAGDVNANGIPDLVFNFTGLGVWVRYDNGSWAQIHPGNVSQIAIGNIDAAFGSDIVLSFPTLGLWSFRNNGAWTQLHPLPVTDLQIGDIDGNGMADVVAQFPTYGEWILFNATSWSFLHAAQASGIVVANMDSDTARRSEVVINFAGAGVWTWTNNASWVSLHPLNVTSMGVVDLDGNGGDDVVLGFPVYGLFVRRNNTSWTNLHPFTPETVAGAR